MSVVRRLMAGLVAAVMAVTLGGCGGGDGPRPGEGTGAPTGKDALEDLARLLKDFDEKKQKPPASLAAIAPVEPVYTAAHLGLVRGDIVYVWGAGLAAGSDKVVANEKKAGTEGGWVLLQNGSVKQMTAEEFKAAPKAGK